MPRASARRRAGSRASRISPPSSRPPGGGSSAGRGSSGLCPQSRLGSAPSMLRIDSVSKRHGRQILFLEASGALARGEKVGLVGPNGAGKTTLFRLLTREEEPDDGQIAIDRGTTLGYFSQDIGEMKGQSVVEATLDGAGPVSDAARKLHELEHALADPARSDELDALVEQFGEAQARFDELGGYALESRAREILAGLGFDAAQQDG